MTQNARARASLYIVSDKCVFDPHLCILYILDGHRDIQIVY